MAIWQKRFPSPPGEILIQWANRVPRGTDAFFWISLFPLLFTVAVLGYGLAEFNLPKLAVVGLLILAGGALLQFGNRWLLHYENFTVTSAGIVRAFPQRELPGVIRLLPLLQAVSARVRFLPWDEVRGVRRLMDRVTIDALAGDRLSFRLRPLRVVVGKQVIDVGIGSTLPGRKVVPPEEAWVMIATGLQRAFLESGGKRQKK